MLNYFKALVVAGFSLRYLEEFSKYFFVAIAIILFLNAEGVDSKEVLSDLVISTKDFENSDITISKALPKEKDKIIIKAKVHNNGEKSISNVQVQFLLEDNQKKIVSIGEKHIIDRISGNTLVVITQEWIVPKNGFYKIIVNIDPDNKIKEKDKNNNKAYLEVPVLSKDIYVHYWQCPKSTKYLHSVMDDNEEGKKYWLERGVIPFQSKGTGAENATTDEIISHWSSAVKDEYLAIAIDEFGTDIDELDKNMASALIKTKEKYPNLLIFCWDAAGILNSFIAEAYKLAADLVMSEQYRCSAREYYLFDEAWEVAEKAGVADKTVMGLGLYSIEKETWITTEQELLRQIKYIKKMAPEIPGIAFFSNCPLHLYKSADKAVYDYFIKPVIWIKNIDLYEVIISNIGGMDAGKVVIKFLSDKKEKGGKEISSKEIELKVGETKSLDMPAGARYIFIEPNEYYTVLE